MSAFDGSECGHLPRRGLVRYGRRQLHLHIPPDPHTTDAVAISYPRRGCGSERVDTTSRGKDIEITVTFDQNCLYAVMPGAAPGLVQVPGALYGRIELGQLPAGNYRVKRYYRDLSESSRSRSFAATEVFSVMPTR